MTEETKATTAPATSEQPPEQTPSPVAVQTPLADTTPAWLRELDTADREVLRRHPVIAGIAGSMFDQWKRSHEAELAQRSAAEAAEGERKRLRELRKTNWSAYDAEMDEREAREEHETELQRHVGETRQQFAERIGRAYRNLPEWSALTPEDFESLAAAVASKTTDDEALEAFAVKSAELVADKRTAKRLNEWTTRELAKEREAIRKEEAAKYLQGTERPDMARPKGLPAKFNPAALSDEEFDKAFPPDQPIGDLIRKKLR